MVPPTVKNATRGASTDGRSPAATRRLTDRGSGARSGRLGGRPRPRPPRRGRGGADPDKPSPRVRNGRPVSVNASARLRVHARRSPGAARAEGAASSLQRGDGRSWPDVPALDLLVVDELSLRQLVWADGLGYLVLHDMPSRSWHLFGPWELWLAPRRRFERPGDKGSGLFLKGKVLLGQPYRGSDHPPVRRRCADRCRPTFQ